MKNRPFLSFVIITLLSQFALAETMVIGDSAATLYELMLERKNAFEKGQQLLPRGYGDGVEIVSAGDSVSYQFIGGDTNSQKILSCQLSNDDKADCALFNPWVDVDVNQYISYQVHGTLLFALAQGAGQYDLGRPSSEGTSYKIDRGGLEFSCEKTFKENSFEDTDLNFCTKGSLKIPRKDVIFN